MREHRQPFRLVLWILQKLRDDQVSGLRVEAWSLDTVSNKKLQDSSIGFRGIQGLRVYRGSHGTRVD